MDGQQNNNRYNSSVDSLNSSLEGESYDSQALDNAASVSDQQMMAGVGVGELESNARPTVVHAPQPGLFQRSPKLMIGLGLALLTLVVAGLLYMVWTHVNPHSSQQAKVALPVSVPSTDLSKIQANGINNAQQLSINGNLQINRGLVLTPSTAPAKPTEGQIYLDSTDHQLYYYNGTAFVSLVSSTSNTPLPAGVSSLGGSTGDLNLGSGLSTDGLSITNSGVLGINGLTGGLNFANVSSSDGVTLTIDNASTTGKGLASFNPTNFLVNGGAVTTVQNINPGATPTFAGVNTNSITPSGTLTVGSPTQALTLQGNGLSTLSATSGSSTTVLAFQSPTANVTYTLPTAPAGSYDICTTFGNCGGGGSGNVSTAGGTTNQITKFSAGQTIADSIISDNGALVTVGGGLTVSGSATFSSLGAGLLQSSAGGAITSGAVDRNSAVFFNTALNVANGGTGSATAAGARTNLGAAASGANSDITSLTGLTTALSLGQGGTGSTTAVGARTNLGAASRGANNDITSLSGLTTALSVIQGGTGASSLALNGILIGNGAGAVTSLVAGASNLCLVSSAGAPVWQACPGSGGVTSIDGQNGILTLANSSGSAGTITINDATNTGTKGIASFNSTNFSVASGAVNTVQNISTTATPTFGGLTLTTALSVANGGTGAITAANARTNLGAAASGANGDITSLSGLTTALSVLQGGTGASSLTANGLLVGNGTSGVTTISAASAGLCLVSNAGAPTFQSCPGGGSVGTSGSATQNKVAKFGASGTSITDSSIYDNGSGVSVGNTSVTGLFNVGASNQFQVSSAGAITSVGLNAGAGLIQGSSGLSVGGSIAFTSLTSGGGQCLTTDGSGNLSLVNCLSGGSGGSGGVSSLNGLSGSLSINNATGSGAAITINNAAADGTTKGIATFNSTNFSAASGIVNTIQGIATTSTPTFAGLTLNASGLSAGGTVTFSGAGFASDGIVTSVSGVLGSGSINLGTTGYLTGTLGVGKGGTGLNTLTANQLLYAGTTSSINQLSNGSANQCLISNGAGAAPSFQTCTGAGGVSSITATTAQSGALTFNGTANQVSVSNTGATFTFATPQDIGTGSDVTFNSLNAASILKTNATTRIDASGNLSNIGTINTSGLITGGNGLTISTGTITFNNLTGGASKCLTLNGSNQVGVSTCATGSGSSPTLQDVYDNSTTTPLINLASVGKGITIQDAATPVGGNLLAVKNSAGTTTYFDVTTSGADITGTLTATNLSGNGSAVTNVNAAQLNGQAASYYLNANNINAGTLGDTFLSSNVALYNRGTSNFTGALQHNGNAVCDTSGNCVGTGGGGAVGGGGTLNKIALFTGSGFTVGDSILSQNVGATTVSVGGNLTATGQTTLGGGVNQTQLVVKANSSQTNANPLILFQSSAGTELSRINADSNNNTAFGTNALALNTTGNYNTAIGAHNLEVNTTGQNNVATGVYALTGNTFGSGNVASGVFALDTNTTGSNNVAVGTNALDGNDVGSYNVGLGYNSVVGSTNLQNATAIGANSRVDQSNSLILGCVAGTNSCATTTKIGVGNRAPAGLFSVGSSSQFQVDINGNAVTTGSLQGANLTVTGTTTLSSLTSGGGQCLTTNGSGVLSLVNCLSGAGGGTGGVASLNGLSGALSINNASGSGSAITINDATTAAKGIASFSSGNFNVTTGAVSIKTGGVTTAEILDGTIANADLAGGTYAAITGTGALAAGSIASGFGVISTGNNITTSAALQGATATLTGASSLTLGTAGPAGNTGSITFKNSTNANTVSIVSGVTTGTYNIVLPTSAGAASDCLVNSATPGVLQFTSCSGAAGGASTSLNNLVSTSINQSLVASANNTLDLGTSSTAWRTGYFGTQVQTATVDSISGALAIGTTNASSINLNQNTVLGAGKSITITGGNTASRPASPTEGMLYYDTTTKSLLVYANGKWQADRSTATKIVASGGFSGCTGTVPVASGNPDAADFVTNSCTSAQTAINNAIAALPAGGGTVYLMEGTYIIDGAISYTGSGNVNIVGAGDATTIKLKDGINAGINAISTNPASTAANIVIRDLKLDGNKANNSSGTQNGIVLANSKAQVRNVTIQNFRNEGLTFDQMGLFMLTGSTITANNGNGLSHNFNDSNSAGTTIDSNYIYSNGGHGIYLNFQVSDPVITNNNISSNTGAGIAFDASLVATHLVMTGNTIFSNGNGGINFFTAGSGGIDKFNISGNTVNSNTGNGISMAGSTNGSISSNTIDNNTGQGVHLCATVLCGSNVSITGNTINSNNGWAVNSDSGFNTGTTSLTVSNNMLLNDGGGVYMRDPTTSNVNNNVITNPVSAPAVQLACGSTTCGSGNSVTGNTIIDTGAQGGVYLDNQSFFSSYTSRTYLSDNNYTGTGTPISDTALNRTIYVNQSNGTGGIINSGYNALTIGTSTVNGTLSLQGGITTSALATPAAPTVTPTGGAGTAYSYAVTALDGTGQTLPSANGSDSGFSTLDGTHYNTITWSAISGATSYKIYRTASAGTPSSTGLITTVTATAATSYSFNDTGIAATTAVPVSNTTGGGTFAGALQGTNGSFTSGTLTLGTSNTNAGSIKLYSTAGTGSVTLNINNPGTNNFTLSVPNLTNNDTICTVILNNCTGSGVTSVGALDGGVANATGATISSSTLYLQSASVSFAGVVNTGSQVFAGSKTFNGNVTIGASAGSGTTLTNNGSIVNSVLAKTDFATGGSIGTAATTVDVYSAISVAQTTAGQALTIPSPTASTAYGRIIYFSNVGTASFTFTNTNLAASLNPGVTAVLVWSNTNGGASWTYAGDGSSILNQNSVTQTANFKISGTGTANVLQAANASFTGTTALTLGTASTNTGAIVFKGSGGAGTLTLTGPTTPNAGNFTLSIPAISSNATICTTDSVCSIGAGGTNNYLSQVPSSNTANAAGANIISPTAASIIGLTVNATTGTAATAAVINQTQNAVGLQITNSGTSSSLSITTTGNPAANNALIFANNNSTTPSGNLLELQNKGTDKFTVDASGNVATSGTYNTNTLSSNSLQFGANSAANVSSNGANTLTVDTGGAAQLNLGTANANAISISKAGFNTLVNGSLTATQLITANAGVTIATGKNFVNGGSTLNSSIALSLGSSGTIGSNTTTVDAATTLDITATAGSLAFTIPSPSVTTSGRIIYVNNVGSNAFSISSQFGGGGSVTVPVGSSANLIWNGTTWTSTAVSTGVSIIGTFSLTAQANGASISGNTITFAAADRTNPGMVSAATQTFGGSKNFAGNIFTVSNAADSAISFKVDTTTGTITLGTGTNSVQFDTTNGFTANTGARHTKNIVLPVEYAGAVLDAGTGTGCTTGNSGIITSGYDSSAARHNFYQWTPSASGTHCYDVIVQIPLPADWAGWTGAPTLYTYNNVGTNSTSVYVQAIGTNGTTDTSYGSFVGISSGTTLQSTNLTAFDGTNYSAGGYMTLKIRMSGAATTTNVRIGNINIPYKSLY